MNKTMQESIYNGIAFLNDIVKNVFVIDGDKRFTAICSFS